MGLAEKRIAKAFQEKNYVELTAEINKLAGKELDFEVNWDTLIKDGQSQFYEDGWTKIYFTPLIESLKAICEDDMGKEAIQESLDKVIIKDESDISNGNSWSNFENKVLTLDHSSIYNIRDVEERTEGLTKTLENGL